MEFASRRGAARTLVAVGLAALLFPAVGAGCRRRASPGLTPPKRPPPAELNRPRTAALDGRVQDEAGRAIPGARVLALGPGDAGAGEAPLVAMADEDGRFRFDHLVAGAYALLVEAPGLAPARRGGVAVPGAEAVVRLAGQGAAVEGVVVAGGVPVAGARVRLGSEGAVARETTSGSDGRFVLHGLGRGAAFVLRAAHGARASRAIAASTGEGAAPARLELGPAFAVTGVVVDERGRPVPEVEVRAESEPGDPLAEAMTTQLDGRFRLGPLAAGAWRLSARAAGFVARTLTLGPAAPPEQRLVLTRAAELFGRVVDARGAVVAKADVRCVAAGGDELAVILAPLPLAAEAAALAPGAGRAGVGVRALRTDAKGAFRVSELPPGAYHLEISRPPSAPLRSPDWTLAAGEARDVGALALRDGTAVSGRVLDETGAPVGGARVQTTPSLGVFAETDGAGAFAFTLPPGRYAVSAAGPGAATVSVDVGATSPAPLELRLSRADARLEGLARDSAFRPLARARVRAYAFEAPVGGAAPDAAVPVATATTDAGGHFTLARVPARPLWIEVDQAGYPVAGLVVAPGARADVTVPVAGALAGEVRERGTGATLARARVEAVGPGGRRAQATVAARARDGGAFRLTRLSPGHWTVTASAPGYAPATRDVDVPASEILGEPSVRDFRLELAPSR
jgi:hypothetical protein